MNLYLKKLVVTLVLFQEKSTQTQPRSASTPFPKRSIVSSILIIRQSKMAPVPVPLYSHDTIDLVEARFDELVCVWFSASDLYLVD